MPVPSREGQKENELMHEKGSLVHRKYSIRVYVLVKN